MAGPLEQRRDPVAERRTAPVTDMERTRGVGRHELDVDLHAAARRSPAIVGCLGKDLREHADNLIRLQEKVDEPGTRNLDAADETRGQQGRQLFHQSCGNRTRRLLQWFRQHEREVRRQVAMGGIAGCRDLGTPVPQHAPNVVTSRAHPERGFHERVGNRLGRPHLPPESVFFLGLSEPFDSVAGLASAAGLDSGAGLESPSVGCFSPARL